MMERTIERKMEKAVEKTMERPDAGHPAAAGTRPETEARYREALTLYRTTQLSLSEICRRTKTPAAAFRSYIRRVHRELMFARHGIGIAPEEARTARLRSRRGQSAAAHAKYGAAIDACGDPTYLEYNISQIAHLFRLSPSGLSRQLRAHFPEIIGRREEERLRRGLNDNLPRGAKRWCREQYAGAVELLRTTDTTIAAAAEVCGVSLSGLREHLLAYHKDIVAKRSAKRKRGRATVLRGALTGRGTRHVPTPEQVEKYREAVRLYRTTALTQKEIAARTGVTPNGLHNHLRTWYPELILEHRGVKCSNRAAERKMRETKHYLKSTAAKYAGAIERLRSSGCPTAEVAREFGLNPEVFRMYLHEHEPALAAHLGMTRLPGGKRVSARSLEKYAEALRLYRTTGEPLRAIARRLDLVYNSLSGFIRRNCPEMIASRRA